MRRRTFTFTVETSDHDADLLEGGTVPEMVRQRFAGTALRLDTVCAVATHPGFLGTIERLMAGLEAENKALRAFVADLAEHGLRADLNPTINMRSADTAYSHWQSYLERLDVSLRERAVRKLLEL